jgi:hypothetical protein
MVKEKINHGWNLLVIKIKFSEGADPVGQLDKAATAN